ncbi:glycosyltransferase [Zobellia galactanivorans]|uniref:glycosyltransferase n=1 Tax=Zobellia galactanivorans (strain DSM 12802 / CCUG 47099 / CIP 106680 / NCIMB 13871 / Dsij) TaxID=63186 RepID=UPI0026E30DCC|nr:glycosyltransferase [Zobellia galactanivorans]MDO6810411.1 glycosyltransferase [Zobellia galactanivorans]
MASILFLIGKYPNYGGTEKVTTILANEFVNNGHSVVIASFEQTVPSLKDELNSDIQLVNLTYPTLSRGNKEKLKSVINSLKIDFIINQWALPFQTNLLCRRAIGKSNCKIISVYHNAPDKNARVTDIDIKLSSLKTKGWKYMLLHSKRAIINTIIRFSVQYVYNHSDRYVILSDSFKKIFSDYAGVKDLHKLVVITNPLTINTEAIDMSQKEKLIVYVGRIDYNQKRVERIIEIWKAIEKELSGWKLEIVGDGPERQKLEEIVDEQNIEKISFEGYQDPYEYYKRASVLLLTSEYEGFGLVIVEGMSLGVVPVVYGSYEAVYDIIENEKTGFVTQKPYRQTDFELIIKQITSNDAVREEMAVKCMVESNKFTLQEISKKWNQLFDNLLENS